jgi:hypothetical protein
MTDHDKPMSMVECVGKAIYEERNGAGCKPWAHLTRSHQGEYLGDARAAMAAMREPTRQMADAAYERQRSLNCAVQTGLNYSAIYETMIDAALTDPK